MRTPKAAFPCLPYLKTNPKQTDWTSQEREVSQHERMSVTKCTRIKTIINNKNNSVQFVVWFFLKSSSSPTDYCTELFYHEK